MNTPKDKQSKENECLDIWTYLAESEASPWQPSNLGEYRQLNLLKSTPMPNEFSDTTSQVSPSTQTSETTTQNQESLKLSQWDFPAQVHQTQEAKQDYPIQPLHSGEKDLDVSLKLNPSSVLWSNLKDLSKEDLELFLPPSIWQDTVLRLKQSRQQALTLDNRGTDCSSFPTLTSNECFTSRPAGQTKCEKWFKDKGLIPSGSQLGTQAIALMMGFPSNWFEGLTEKYSKNLNIQNQVKPQAEFVADTSQEEPLHQPKHRSPSEEFSISIPCLVRQPKQPEVKGIIQKDLGDRFVVYVSDSDSTVTVSKLFVYPDFSKSVGQIPPPKETSPPSKNSPTKQRRKKGDGTGYIYRRTITRRGKQYQESYYRYRDESGKLKAKYIPQRLLYRVEEAESRKLPIADILILLGGDEISRGEQFSTFDVQNNDENNQSSSVSRGEQTTPPSTRKRKQGEGTGYIECKPVKRSGKEYKQYWYHYEEWRSGDKPNGMASRRKFKKSRYIPKRLVTRVQKMEAEKAPVNMILEVLIGKNKRSKK